jgi:hypothetical protein
MPGEKVGKARMMELMMRWMPSCREVSGLVAQDALSSVSGFKRFLIRMHLSMCSICSQFAGQMKLLEKAFRERWKQGPNPEKLAAIRRRLLERLSR